MSNELFNVGMILRSRMRKYAKIISFSNGIFGLSAWTSLEHAQKSDKAMVRFNRNALARAGFEVVSVGESVKTDEPTHAKNDCPVALYSESKLNKMSATDVRALATQLGIESGGTKKENIAKILEL